MTSPVARGNIVVVYPCGGVRVIEAEIDVVDRVLDSVTAEEVEKLLR